MQNTILVRKEIHKATEGSLPACPAFLPGDDFLFWNRGQKFWIVEVDEIFRVEVLGRGAIQETRGGCWDVQRFPWGLPAGL